MFYKCLRVLLRLMWAITPPTITVHSATAYVIIYGFVDSSGGGFGGTLQHASKINYPIGTWSSKEEDNSSNWKEFGNLVLEVERAAQKGWLSGSTVLLATDNSAVDRCLYKGNSTSEKLFNLIVRLCLV